MHRYMYSVLRFVPELATGEFVNVGAIAGSDEQGDWHIREISNQRRVVQVDHHKVYGKVSERISLLQRDVVLAEEVRDSGEPSDVTEQWLECLYRGHHGVLQFSEPMPMLAESAVEAVEMVFDKMVIDPGVKTRARNKAAARGALLRAYRSAGLCDEHTLRERPTIKTSKQASKFDFAVTNGKAVQLASAWSFEVQTDVSKEVKAWAWQVQELRKIGGTIAVNGTTLEVPSDVDIEVLYIPPTADEGRRALDEAMAVFDDPQVKARARTEAHAEDIATEAKARLQHSIALHNL